MPKSTPEILDVGGTKVSISNPDKVYFPEPGYTKRDLALYYVAVAEGALRGSGGRPNMMVRYPDGVKGEFFYQKRAPESRPAWVDVVEIRFPSGRGAEEIVPRAAADLAWMANLGCLELHPHPVRADDLDHPDELRVDLDPVPGVTWKQVQQVARVVRETLDELGMTGWPKTSGKRGLHVNVRIKPQWTFDEVRRAALALAREVERRAPKLATSAWWKEERHGVFIDYNQNARDRTVAGAYSVRPTPNAQVSAPLAWEEVDACEPADFTLETMVKRYRKLGDVHAAIDRKACALTKLLELSAKQEKEGLGDAPWPGTDALFWTEVELRAPDKPGSVMLAARFDVVELDEPHAGVSSPFNVSVVAKPEHTLTVKVVADGMPVEEAIVRLGPTRASTDASGVAAVKLAKGRYELVVWKAGYDTPVTPLRIDADASVQIDARVMPQADPDAVWTA